ncbi:aldehyde-activating protein [Vibrio nigripulchritudo]|uniref:GFA family protein n=1 Tax=Vibrio nigripulchritudo TaxID=28173 RepID=UPI00190A53AB|nr:GFA family protein [Vibrio nigripulchritudo]BCL69982.1 aldehyde-activating protein [Vibrio nigripulchritudo]BDU31331.1 aldehyde-activating protein [Vibrio nigripulchritudo]
MVKSGSCLCGEVQVEVSGDPIFVIACHCIKCQKRTGSPLGITCFFPESAVKVSGELKDYQRGSDSGREITHHFCSTCGTQALSRTPAVPNCIGISSGVFDDTTWIKPQMHAYTKTKMSCIEIPEGTMAFDETPQSK